jgi:hypothetical protein
LIAASVLAALAGVNSQLSTANPEPEADPNAPVAIVPSTRLSLSSGDAIYGSVGLAGWWGRAGLGPVMGGLSVYGIRDLRSNWEGDTLGSSLFLRMALSRPNSHYMALEVGPSFEAGSPRGGSRSLAWGGFISPRFLIVNGAGTGGVDVGLRLETMGRYDHRDFRVGLEFAFPMGRGLKASTLAGDSAERDAEWLASHYGVAKPGSAGIVVSEAFALDEQKPSRTWDILVDEKECVTVAAAHGGETEGGEDVDLEISNAAGKVVASDRQADSEPVASYCPAAGEKALTVKLLRSAGAPGGSVRITKTQKSDIFGETHDQGKWTSVLSQPVLLPFAPEPTSWAIRRPKSKTDLPWALEAVPPGTQLLVLGLPAAGLRATMAPCNVKPADESWMVGSRDRRAIVAPELTVPDLDKEAKCLRLSASQTTPVRVYIPAKTEKLPIPDAGVADGGRDASGN